MTASDPPLLPKLCNCRQGCFPEICCEHISDRRILFRVSPEGKKGLHSTQTKLEHKSVFMAELLDFMQTLHNDPDTVFTFSSNGFYDRFI